ncbi:unnamed protein product [Prorocentrum cordatum]|uniref:Inosine/uridine-preferring nucleoside hydrolase domain-containing protein n=1 Tax=Prorocentrum cordatum TaxID=2364126 RepID=A0ABN9WYW6_9DINO|nr:unnamed protein product [Polarella glacialis]
MPPKPQPRRVIIDTDPGVDDALAILFALGSSPALQVEGLTIAAGNIKNIRELGANAKLLLRLAGAEGIPVSLGRPAEEEAGVGPCEDGRGSDGGPALAGAPLPRSGRPRRRQRSLREVRG